MADARSQLSFEEISELQERKAEVKESARAYVQAHPELHRLMQDFVAAVLRDKPKDPVAYAATFFGPLGAAASAASDAPAEGGVGGSP